MIDHSTEIMVEIIQKISLLSQIREELVAVDVIFCRVFRIKMLLDCPQTVLHSVKALKTDFTQIQRLDIGLLRLEIC